MSSQFEQIIREFQQLSPAEQAYVRDWVRENVSAVTVQPPEGEPISEDEVQRTLLDRGVISNTPNAADYTDADDDFDPIEIEGEPLSETVIRERR
jgi:hypothetical protein